MEKNVVLSPTRLAEGLMKVQASALGAGCRALQSAIEDYMKANAECRRTGMISVATVQSMIEHLQRTITEHYEGESNEVATLLTHLIEQTRIE